MNQPYMLSTWVKAPRLRGSIIAIVAACLPYVNQELFKEVTKGKEVLLACPEREPQLHYGKLASIIRSSRPKELHIYTIEGSPHCFALHASANEAEYILGEKLVKRHFVIVDAEKLIEIDPDAVRIARYLHIVDELIKKYPEALEKLQKYSLEYRFSKLSQRVKDL
ncbi:MAG: 4Fe-4S ferredoxin [Thermoprotei archaeon]|nr:MAG: 4Fe-4S ferredoxin [Thermoprotei archaeon]